jgi:formylglycine-generating enzyme required for sulfatase activity
MRGYVSRWSIALLGGLLALQAIADDATSVRMAAVPGGKFASVLPPAPGIKQVAVADFRLDRTPVTNAQFARFAQQHPEWRRDRIAAVFADDRYLSHWSSATGPGDSLRNRPVVHVSWFAASAYCEARGARLPTWYEWEYAAAASATSADARSDAAWQRRILDWYSRSARGALPDVGTLPANYYGIQDLHGVVWEWVYDLSSMLVSGDNREQSDPDALRFCGPGALTMEQKENYATLMRIAMLSSMQARYTSAKMGFRCATDDHP